MVIILMCVLHLLLPMSIPNSFSMHPLQALYLSVGAFHGIHTTVHCVPHHHRLTYARLLQGRCGTAGSTVTALVTDVCPECSAASGGEGDHFDLNALSFGQLAPDLAGRIDVNYRLVACTPPSDIQVMVDGNSGSGLWLRLVITVSYC